MRLLSDLYNVTLKRGIRGAASEGFIRPTIGQSFMSDRDFSEVPSILSRIGYEPQVATAGASVVSTSHATAGPSYSPWQVLLNVGDPGAWAPDVVSDDDPAWFVVKMSEPKRIEKMVVFSKPYDGGVEQMKDYKLEASNTGDFSGEEVLLYSRTFPLNHSTPVTCLFENDNHYLYYKFYALNNYLGNGNSDRAIHLVSLYQGTYTPAPTLPTNFGPDQCFGGTVTSNPASHSGYEAENLFEGNPGRWAPIISEEIEAPSWVVYEFLTAKKIQKLRIKSWYFSGYEPIAGFKFEASDTGDFSGEQSKLIETIHEYQTVEGFQDYIFVNSDFYKYYRLYVYTHHTGNWNHDRQIKDVQMMEAV